MTNTEFADTLEKLAAKYRADKSLAQIGLYGFPGTKEELRASIKSLGGKWRKSGMDDTSDYASIYFYSEDFAPLQLGLPRNKVCRKIVRFECDPIMSPEEEAEVLA